MHMAVVTGPNTHHPTRIIKMTVPIEYKCTIAKCLILRKPK